MNSETIKVFVRFRPLNKREEETLPCVKIDPEKSCITVDKHKYTFDGVFDGNSTQDSVYDIVAKGAVSSVIQGYNSTIFAYGPTSSGKTHTMFGYQGAPGIIPKACSHIFTHREDVVDRSVSCCFLEIYREKIKDLLSGESGLRIRQDKFKGNYVEGITEKYVHTPEEILETIKEGTIQRSVASTALNSVSSRSHAVLSLTVKQKFSDGSDTVSKLHLIDLAGSENVGKSQVQGISLAEAQTINKSLSCLGNVIYALTEKGRDHIPYRDSKLTFLLQDSLGGNSKTVLIATASPSSASITETLSTLNFAKRVKEIQNAPKVNKFESTEHLLKVIEELKRRISESEGKYQELKNIVESTENTPDKKANIENKILRRKIEKLEKERLQDDKRHEKYIDLMRRTRMLFENIKGDLERERIKSYRLEQELENYKSLYDTLKSSDDSILPMIVHRFKIPEIHVNSEDFEITDVEEDLE